MTKKQLKKLISKSNIKDVLDFLIENNENFEIELLALSSRFEKLNQDHRIGLVSEENFRLERQSITKSLIDIVNEIDFDEEQISNLAEKLKNNFDEINTGLTKIMEETKKFQKKIANRKPSYTWIKEFNKEINEVEQKINKQIFQVALVALSNSGKSTLLNAWIGGEYLSSATVAETMRVVRVRHTPDLKEGRLIIKGKEQAEGPKNVRQKIRKLNDVSRNSVEIFEDNEAILEISLEGLSSQPLGNYGFDILDTPGTNESGVITLKAKVERILKSVDVVVYLLDYSKLKQQDEKELFKSLRQWREGLLKELSTRLFFAVNKIDISNRHDTEQNLNHEEIKKYVRKILEKQIEGLKVSTQEIFLVSAEEALLGRLILSEEYSEAQLKDFKKIAFGKYNFMDIPKETLDKMANYLVQESGLKELEKGVLTNIYNNRTNIFFRSIVDDLTRIFNQVENNIEFRRTALKADRYTVSGLKNKITHTEKKINGIDLKKEEFKKKAEDFIKEKFEKFQKDVNDSIFDIFSADESAKAKNYLLPTSLTNKLKSTRLQIESSSKSSVESKVKELNEKIFQALDNEFESLWNLIVENMYGLYYEFSDSLYKDIKPLVTKIEEVIKEDLHINLNPANLTPKKLNLDEFYQEIQKTVDEYIREETVFSPRIYTKEKQFKGWKPFGFRILKPRKIKVIAIQLVEKRYFASSYAYREGLKKQIAPLIKNSIKVANSVIDKQFINVVNDAQNALENYSEQYIEIIEKEIENVKGGTDISERYKASGKDLESLKEIQNIVGELTKKMKRK